MKPVALRVELKPAAAAPPACFHAATVGVGWKESIC